MSGLFTSSSIHPLLAACLTVALIGAPAGAQRGAPAPDSAQRTALDTVRVVGRVDDLIGIAASASEGRIGAADLRRRPITREGELLETVPGVIVTQHSGEGKANQFFVRGFNLDHGTDFRTTLEEMPLNMPSHGHGQGYTDLNFLIPELVDHLEYRLGVHHAEIGDFGSAGGAEIRLLRTLERPFAAFSGGGNGYARGVGATGMRVHGGDLLVAGEAKTYDGPWVRPGAVRKLSAMARWSVARGTSSWSLLALAYGNRWNANDQIALRAVSSGAVPRFGQIDSSDGGRAQRFSVSGTWTHVGARSVQDVALFAIRSDLGLFSNFTYFLADPVRGDQFAQTDRRTILGASARHRTFTSALGAEQRLTFGAQVRSDLVHGLGLYRTARQVRLETIREDRVRASTAGLYVEAESRWGSRVRSVLGVRGDGFAFDVASDRAANSGHRLAAVASPKASVVFTPSRALELYLSGGLGFHSNDARGTTTRVDPASGDSVSPVDPIARSRGAEVGARYAASGFRSTISLWSLALDGELVFAGDAGTTEASAASVRRGVTVASFYRPMTGLTVDGDVSLARARFCGVAADATRIPGALERVIAAGVSWDPAELGSAEPRHGVFGALRARHFGSYPLTEDGRVRARASTLFNADAGYRLGRRTRVQASLLNVLNAAAHDIEYFYASRLGDEPVSGVEGVHAHPTEPRQIRIAVERRF